MDITQPPLDLTACDREAIHIPGAIQPHGMMLVADCEHALIRHAAGDIEGRLGVKAWMTQPLGRLIGDPLARKVTLLDKAETSSGFMGQHLTTGGETLDVTAHRSGAYVTVELETASQERLSASVVIDSLARAAIAFECAVSIAALCDRAADEFRRFTGFDRVMVYRFLENGSGKVLAESRMGALHSFLGHHFPASDIPVQARALYVGNPVRVIPDAAYVPVPLRPAWTDPAPLDMSDCSLRSVSPIHLTYLAHMGVRASASFSIVLDGTLWGLVACHHTAPRVLTYDIRAACRSLAGSLGRRIKSKDEADAYRESLRLREFADDIVALLSRGGAPDDGVAAHLGQIARMFGGEGAAIIHGRALSAYGACPAAEALHDLARWLLLRQDEPVFATNFLSNVYPAARGFAKSASGVLAITLSEDDPRILLVFRPEQVEDVKWAGNPHKASDDPAEQLTPRASFAAWLETINGRASDWSAGEVQAAANLRTALLDVQQNRRVWDLNHQLNVILRDKDILLQEKEFLIAEVNHRVQNSLQLVSGFLSMQARSSGNPDVEAALGEARHRLTAVALMHRRLYHGEKADKVDADRYIEELCEDTCAFMGMDWKQHLTLALSPMKIPTDQAIPLGLVLTELLINANKHAYAGNPGPIAVSLIEDCAHFRMIVSDCGVGIASTKAGYGSRIMTGLVKQLGGTLTFADNGPGVRAVVEVPHRLAPADGRTASGVAP